MTRAVEPANLREYKSDLDGPLFAVSDEGSAAEALVSAAYASAKVRAVPNICPLTLGVALDGERMTSAGETPIGPVEYRDLTQAAAGRVLLTTNIGVRVNARLNQHLPEFALDAAAIARKGWIDPVCEIFRPFINTPDGAPRPLTIRLVVSPGQSLAPLKHATKLIESARRQGRIGPPELHRVTVLAQAKARVLSSQLGWVDQVMRAAQAAGVAEVALDGEMRDAARKRLGVQTLLNILHVRQLNWLLDKAHDRGVSVSYRYQIDLESAARTIWTGLEAARSRGFTAGKYGLVPLSLEEQAFVIELITRWSGGFTKSGPWTAIPAFYVDTPLVTSRKVYDVDQAHDAARVWLKMARGAGATVVLFDSPDRVSPRRLLKTNGGKKDIGVLTLDQVRDLNDVAQRLGVSILWSGGITAQQAFDLAREHVHGIFSTSSTAVKIPVSTSLVGDPNLAAENEPTEAGIRRIHAIVQGGFLTTALRARGSILANRVEESTRRLIAASDQPVQAAHELAVLDPLLVDGWRAHYARFCTPSPRLGMEGALPVPPDAVRVFRGRKRQHLDHGPFIAKLGTAFMPMTVQMQRLYGLTAYLPAIAPRGKHASLPDEVALVFYRTQGSYHEAKRCVGGRAYSELHELVFDMSASRSEFPVLFAGSVDFDRPYYLFERSVDWQSGQARMFMGTRSAKTPTAEFKKRIANFAMGRQSTPGVIDAAIFCVSQDWVLWWEHAEQAFLTPVGLETLATSVLAGPPRRLRPPHSLTEPYAGITLNPQGDFLNFAFQRVALSPSTDSH